MHLAKKNNCPAIEAEYKLQWLLSGGWRCQKISKQTNFKNKSRETVPWRQEDRQWGAGDGDRGPGSRWRGGGWSQTGGQSPRQDRCSPPPTTKKKCKQTPVRRGRGGREVDHFSSTEKRQNILLNQITVSSTNRCGTYILYKKVRVGCIT